MENGSNCHWREFHCHQIKVHRSIIIHFGGLPFAKVINITYFDRQLISKTCEVYHSVTYRQSLLMPEVRFKGTKWYIQRGVLPEAMHIIY